MIGWFSRPLLWVGRLLGRAWDWLVDLISDRDLLLGVIESLEWQRDRQRDLRRQAEAVCQRRTEEREKLRVQLYAAETKCAGQQVQIENLETFIQKLQPEGSVAN